MLIWYARQNRMCIALYFRQFIVLVTQKHKSKHNHNCVLLLGSHPSNPLSCTCQFFTHKVLQSWHLYHAETSKHSWHGIFRNVVSSCRTWRCDTQNTCSPFTSPALVDWELPYSIFLIISGIFHLLQYNYILSSSRELVVAIVVEQPYQHTAHPDGVLIIITNFFKRQGFTKGWTCKHALQNNTYI